jgi:flagellar FliJ protein
MKFQFRLEPVLRLRLRDEENAKRELGLAVGLEQKEREALQALQNELSVEVASQTQARNGVIWAQGQALYLEWAIVQNGRIASQRQVCHEAAQAVQAARLVVVEARRAVQVLEKLKERRHAQWKLDLSRKEQIFTSEVAAQRWSRQRSAGG